MLLKQCLTIIFNVEARERQSHFHLRVALLHSFGHFGELNPKQTVNRHHIAFQWVAVANDSVKAEF